MYAGEGAGEGRVDEVETEDYDVELDEAEEAEGDYVGYAGAGGGC